uniref:RING-type domain-containing protein n=2 Tax=Amphimedon queenslandica TaxID=400682 RepID=A0A1X7TJS5_AMPQE
MTVPNEYPASHVQLEFKESNLPVNLYHIMKGQTVELLRQCIEPPIRRNPRPGPFVPRPSLQFITNYLVVDCLRSITTDSCPVCNKRALPTDPKDIINDEGHPQYYVYRIYCGHLYHFQCLDSYMKTPPFTGGKKCVKCGQRVFHDKWNVPPRLADERWAHQEARKREIAEVAEFLGFD